MLSEVEKWALRERGLKRATEELVLRCRVAIRAIKGHVLLARRAEYEEVFKAGKELEESLGMFLIMYGDPSKPESRGVINEPPFKSTPG